MDVENMDGDKMKGDSYRERREKSNASGKKSREARKKKELHTRVKLEHLNDENIRLRELVKKCFIIHSYSHIEIRICTCFR